MQKTLSAKPLISGAGISQSGRQSQQTSVQDGSGGPIKRAVRHCAFCLEVCAKVHLCGNCMKRAYCCRQCQIADWQVDQPVQKGQGHKNWCRWLDCGEEGVDWEVVPVPGKGMGLVAKKPLPPLFRIIVEAIHTDPYSHPAIKDLCPIDGTLQEKYAVNCISANNEAALGPKATSYIGLRIARANHNCDPNADIKYDDTARVLVLFAQRQIQPGEEICITYCPFNAVSVERGFAYLGLDADDEFKYCKEILRSNWGITCPPECLCNDATVRALVAKGRRLIADIERFSWYHMHSIDTLLSIQERIHSPLFEVAHTHYSAFKEVDSRKADSYTRNRAAYHIRTVHKIYSSVVPFSRFTRVIEELVNKLNS